MKLRFCLTMLAVTASVAAACGGHTQSAGDVCAQAWDLMTSGCVSGSLPPNDLTRLKGRYTALCAAELSLPGVNVGQFSACVQSLQGNCRTINNPTVCQFSGSLTTGAACNFGAQCESGGCPTGGSSSSSGGTPTCGTCQPALAAGQDCSGSGTCANGTTCQSAASDGGNPPARTCQTVTYGDVGAACPCKQGLACGSVGVCIVPLAKGQTCTFTNECAYPLVCLGMTGGTRTCQDAVAAGGTCAVTSDCVSGLTCDTSTSLCVATTWAEPGAGCGGAVQCRVGSCLNGTCLTVIADGQPCVTPMTTTTCDRYANCLNGVCTLPPGPVCR